jgi:large conductance mechanosensitive channel
LQAEEPMEPLEPLERIKNLPTTRKALSVAEEFKEFAFKGNVIDLAVGVILGAAFGKLIESLVKNIIMPLISVVMPGDQSYTAWALEINGKRITFGEFLGDAVNFLIVAAALFVIAVKLLGWLFRARKEEELATPTKEQELLTEIRDLLKKNATEK